MILKTSVWSRVQTIQLSVAKEIAPGFNICFDRKIPKTTQAEQRIFIEWMENNFRISITCWVDFVYKHYLIRRDGKWGGYLFYWADFDSYPVFDNPADIPELRLAVREEHWTIEEILTSFIEGIMCYYA